MKCMQSIYSLNFPITNIQHIDNEYCGFFVDTGATAFINSNEYIQNIPNKSSKKCDQIIT